MDNQSLCRRSGPRSSIPFPISFRISGDASERPARIRDMSARGISFYSDHALTPAAQLEVVLLVPYEITLTQLMPVRMLAQVLRVDDAAPARTVAVILGLPPEIAPFLPSAGQA